MNVVIIGAGIAGLSTAICLARKGHAVTVLEESKALSEYGAGLQISPNAIRILDNWGLRKDLEEIAFAPTRTFMRRYSSGEILSTINQNPNFERKHGFPYVQRTYNCSQLLTIFQLLADLSARFAESVIPGCSKTRRQSHFWKEGCQCRGYVRNLCAER